MNQKKIFEATMLDLQRQIGKKAVLDNYQLFTEIVRWQIEHGWGEVILSAKHHYFSNKLRLHSIVELKSINVIS